MAVASTYDLAASTGQHPRSSRDGIRIDCNGPLCWAFLGFSNENFISLLENMTDEKLIDASSDTRRSDAKANKTAVLRDSMGKERDRFSPRDAI